MNYFITSIYDAPGLFVHRKARRTFGYFGNLDRAFKAVENDEGSLHECLYNYLVIEAIGEGIHAYCNEDYWFEWQDNHWQRISGKPELFNGTINFALG